MKLPFSKVRICSKRFDKQSPQPELLLLEEWHSEILEVLGVEIIEVLNPSLDIDVKKFKIPFRVRMSISGR